ncbi:MAG: sporulation protein YqfC [Dethiobacter sp.]|nr:sporulation protein YqfC [Dethiobacter sp.]MBS3899258.1 sporulation protein YqfC [Dethiobacter sp.]MBS3982923.1 sporulation protein YqfC [Dethiobacter sp.]MCL4464247.1 sporulation protein YqfC [Bacillota bacterium]MCL5993316.1 sporulation protein YqfC [Bacillota bacterium]
MSGKGAGKWRQSLADLLELPREIVLNLPRLTVIGNLQCYLENHRGVIEYSSEKVRLSVNGGEVTISGSDLVIRYLGSEEVAIDGTINTVRYEF